MNEGSNVSAKVAPPRLEGERRGVFSTRSPHRPCPIGLSLVKLHSIDGKYISLYIIKLPAFARGSAGVNLTSCLAHRKHGFFWDKSSLELDRL